MFTRYNTVDQADAKDAMEKLDSLYSKEEQPSAAIVLQAQKKGQEKPPNPLISLAPLRKLISNFYGGSDR